MTTVAMDAVARTETVDLTVPAGAHAPRAMPRSVRRMLGPVVLLACWQIASSTGLIDPSVLAGPWTVVTTAASMISDGTLPHNLWISLERALIGLTIGVCAGLVLAVLSGLSRLGEDFIDAPMQLLRTTPILAIVPLAIVWFGLGEEMKIALVAMGSAVPIYLTTFAAIRGVDGRYVELARTLGLSRWELIRRVVLPGSLPGFLVGLRYALSVSWLILVVSEQINASSGIGYLMEQARTFGQTDVIVVGLAVYGTLGLVSDGLVRLLERHALAWRRGLDTA